jgi:hypothetical protein
MTILDFFTLFVFLTLIAAGVAALIFVGGLPGRVARRRNHPQAQAIGVAGWVGLIAGGIFWPLSMIWAYGIPFGVAGLASQGQPPDTRHLQESLESLRERVAALEDRLAQGPTGETPRS